MNKGKLIILEGPMGSGKTTQAKILFEKLKAAHLSVKMFEYPDIANNLISRSINRMIDNPDYDLTEATRVLLDSINSSQTMKTINQCLRDGIYVICEGSYISTIVKYCYLNKIDNYEDIIGIIAFANMGVAPDLAIVFDAPPKLLIDRNVANNVEYNINIEDLEKIRTGYLLEAKNNGLPIIFTTDPVDQVSDLVWEKVAKCIAIRSISNYPNDSLAMPTALSEILDYKAELLSGESNEKANEPYIKKENGHKIISESGIQYLKSIVTNPVDDVYAFKDSISSNTVAAAITKSLQNKDDLLVTLLEDFPENTQADKRYINNLISKSGNDSIQQLSGFHIVIDGASNLLARKIDSNPFVTHIELSNNRKSDYFVPKELDISTKKNYIQTMDKILSNYFDMVKKLNDYLIKTSKTTLKNRDLAWKLSLKTEAQNIASMALPVSAKLRLGIYGSGKNIENLIISLMSDDLAEVRIAAKKILENIRQIAPAIFERTDSPSYGGVDVAYKVDTNHSVVELSDKKIKKGFSSDLEKIKLVDFYPKNEIELVPYMLYESTDLSLAEIKSEVDKWPYKDKIALFENYMGTRYNSRNMPGSALEIARYTWEIICDYRAFSDFQSHQIVDSLVWQNLTPRFGFEVPKIIDDAGLTDKYQDSFDLSLKLYSLLMLKKYDKQAQYSTLIGHKMRFQATINGSEAFKILESGSGSMIGSSSRELLLDIYQKLSEVHPTIAGSMNFIDSKEESSLTKLAVERYKQLKLKKII